MGVPSLADAPRTGPALAAPGGPAGSLLGQCQRLLENTYDARTGVNLEDFVVGPDRCRQLSARAADGQEEYGEGGRFFYYLSGGDLRMAIFYTDELIERLETHDPRRGLDEANVLEFAVFLEELSHALHTSLAFRENRRRLTRRSFPAELEVQAKIDVFLALAFFRQRLAGAERLSPAAHRWIETHLFDRWATAYASAPGRSASALAVPPRKAAARGRRHLAFSSPSSSRRSDLTRVGPLSVRERGLSPHGRGARLHVSRCPQSRGA
jgi:hypothetical protein